MENFNRTKDKDSSLAFLVDLAHHKLLVGRNLIKLSFQLWKRALLHDLSKVRPPEYRAFSKTFALFKQVSYPSSRYQQLLERVRPALKHHYQNNRHHPEYHPHGITDMTLVDLLEMLCDWKAASARHQTTLEVSLDTNRKRFAIPTSLFGVLCNQATSLRWATKIPLMEPTSAVATAVLEFSKVATAESYSHAVGALTTEQDKIDRLYETLVYASELPEESRTTVLQQALADYAHA